MKIPPSAQAGEEGAIDEGPPLVVEAGTNPDPQQVDTVENGQHLFKEGGRLYRSVALQNFLMRASSRQKKL